MTTTIGARPVISIPRHSVPAPHGTIIIVDPAAPREVQMDVLQCCHCQFSWVVRPGSGKRRGFCLKCNQVTCGSPGCHECVPIERRIELYEAGKRATI